MAGGEFSVMSWADFGNGSGVYRSGSTKATTIQFESVPLVMEEIQTAINERFVGIRAPLTYNFHGMTFQQLYYAVNSLRGTFTTTSPSPYVYYTTNLHSSPYEVMIINDLIPLVNDAYGYEGNWWLPFEYPQDGRVYQQLLNVIDNIRSVTVASGYVMLEHVAIGDNPTPNTWAAAFNKATVYSWSDLVAPLITAANTSFWYVFHRCNSIEVRPLAGTNSEKFTPIINIDSETYDLQILFNGQNMNKDSSFNSHSKTYSNIEYSVTLNSDGLYTISDNFISSTNPVPLLGDGVSFEITPAFTDYGATWTKKSW